MNQKQTNWSLISLDQSRRFETICRDDPNKKSSRFRRAMCRFGFHEKSQGGLFYCIHCWNDRSDECVISIKTGFDSYTTVTIDNELEVLEEGKAFIDFLQKGEVITEEDEKEVNHYLYEKHGLKKNEKGEIVTEEGEKPSKEIIDSVARELNGYLDEQDRLEEKNPME